MNNKKEKIMLAMSGGVDSSAALLLLKDEYEVLGVTLRLFDNEDIFDNESKTCCSLSDAEDAKLVAGRFGIPHYVYNFNERFKKDVINRFNEAYLRGLTPNPCIDCNKYIKFDAMLERALSLDCDYMATGHYARVEYDDCRKRWLLKKSVCNGSENEKDQTYVLYNLTQFQLSHTLFPLGNMSKNEVRILAEKNRLVNYKKPDSQDICFVPEGDYAGFIKKYTGITLECGNVTDRYGKILGTHGGIINYTIGQRRGLGISSSASLYVTGKDAGNNIVTVGTEEDLYSAGLIAKDINWIISEKPENGLKLKAKTRYRQMEQPCEVFQTGDGKIRVEFGEKQRAVTPGQSVVFYDGDTVAGGGVIESVIF